MKPTAMTATYDRLRYSTETATLLCGDDWWDGNNFERQGRQAFLYRTKNGRYFAVRLTCWQGEHDHIEPLDTDDALALFETCAAHERAEISFAEAFPSIEFEDA